MAKTYTQIHIQFVFAVKFRSAIIHSSWREELHKYIAGIIREKGHKLLAIYAMPDHIHIFIGMRPTESIAELMKDVKGFSSKWINEKKFLKTRFEWQEGYGGFSYSKTHVPAVIKYINNQEEHHRRKTFIEEYIEYLNTFKVDFNEKYIFKDPQ